MKYTSQSIEFIKYTDGRGVNSVVDYYYATATEDAILPERGSDAWKRKIEDTGFNAVNKYLWNYEKIEFTFGDPSTTEPGLISIWGKEIAEIYEFYMLNNSEAVPDDAPYLDQNGTVQYPTGGNNWQQYTAGMSIPVPTEDNRYLWNREITRYTDNTAYNSNIACVAVHGGALYSMSLDNDSDVIAISSSSGMVVGDYPIINITTYKGDKINTGGSIKFIANNCEVNQINDNNRSYKITSVGNDSVGSIVFEWDALDDGSKIIVKSFSFTKIASMVDYNLNVSPTTINKDKGTTTVSVSILQKQAGQSAKVIAPNDDTSITVEYKKNNQNWQTLSAGQFEIKYTEMNAPCQIRIVNNNGSSFIWDQETIEFVSDGEPGSPGSPGSPGAPGEPGSDGDSAYEIALKNGYEGTEEDWLASLKGSDAEVTYRNVFKALTNSGQDQGTFYDDNGDLYINATFIRSGYLEANLIITDALRSGKQTYGDATAGFYIGPSGVSFGDSKAYLKIPPSGSILAHNLSVEGMSVKSLDAGGWHMEGNELYAVGQDFKLKTNGNFEGTLSGSLFKGSLQSKSSSYTTNVSIDGVTISGSNSTAFVALYADNTNYCGVLAGTGYRHKIEFTQDHALLTGTWVAENPQALVSDRNLKNSIAPMSDQHEILFDALQPCVYRYNHGTSNRLHTGFIAQEVLEAMNTAGISTQDFAGYVELKDTNPDTGEEEITCALRYEEFIALAVHKIQKLTPRISATEQEILSLKQEISELRAEIQNLKNS